MTYGYLDYCPQCGSERGPGGHECVAKDTTRFEVVLPETETPPLIEPPREPLGPPKPWPAWVGDVWARWTWNNHRDD